MLYFYEPTLKQQCKQIKHKNRTSVVGVIIQKGYMCCWCGNTKNGARAFGVVILKMMQVLLVW